MTTTIKCGTCKKDLPDNKFSTKKNGNLYKTCNYCRDINIKFRERNKNKFHCIECEYKCPCESALLTHIKIVHSGVRDVACEYKDCRKRFPTISDRNKHILHVHEEKEIICDAKGCNFKCINNTRLISHINQVHLLVRNYLCDVDGCNFTSFRKYNLEIHDKSVHKGIKDFECEIEGCDFKCCTNGELQQHLRTCTGKFGGSSGEFKIINILKEYQLDYSYNSSFNSLRSINNGYLRFDFIIYIENQILFIEYDGGQHYHPATFGGCSKEKAEKNFIMIQANDKIKNDYCRDNGFPLLRIKYNDDKDIHMKIRVFVLENLLKLDNDIESIEELLDDLIIDDPQPSSSKD